jgi:hypothetical protein
MQGIGQFIRRHYDIITPASLFLLTTVSALSWMPSFIGVPRDVLVIAVSPVLTMMGVFMAHRLNEKVKNPKLRILQWGIHRPNDYSVRLFADVENKAGREVARDARATITIKKITDKDREVDLEPADLVTDIRDLVDADDPLISALSELNPRIEGEPIPWMIPEMPYQSKGIHNIEFKHIANIGPGQRNRAIILQVIHLRDNDKTYYYLKVFSEYGTEPASFQITQETHPSYYLFRKVRCVLKPGFYIFRLHITADKAHSVTGLIEVDTKNGEIKCLEPDQKTISLKNLHPIDKSNLLPGSRLRTRLI